MDEDGSTVLPPPAVTALKERMTKEVAGRVPMERTVSMDIRDEREDLRQAAEQTLNVIMDIGLDGTVRWVSPSWQDVVGTNPVLVLGRPVADLLAEKKTAFADAIQSMQEDDSKSYIVRFSVPIGPASVLQQDTPLSSNDGKARASEEVHTTKSSNLLELEAQGITVHDRSYAGNSHTMWMIRPFIQREVTIDLPEALVESLGVGAEMLAHYLTVLAEVGASDPANHPSPLPVLCRICERQITPWWFEKHTELCLQEHRAEMEVQVAQESLSEHRSAIVKVLDSLEAQSSQMLSSAVDNSASLPPTPQYKGMPIGPLSTPSSGPSSGRVSPASPPSLSRTSSASALGHHRARSFAIRRPLARIVELVLDLCDTASEISTPGIKETQAASAAEFRTLSPQSENRISQVLQWQSPSTGIFDQSQGLAALCDDTSTLSKAKVDAVVRHRRILEYSERIRCEFDVLVQECIDAALRKAAQVAEGDVSDSSTEEEPHTGRKVSELPFCEGEEPAFRPSFNAPSAIAMALRNASDPTLNRRRSSAAASSTRSSSPRGCPTPKSYGGASSAIFLSQRNSAIGETEVGGDSDSGMRSIMSSGLRRAGSSASDFSVGGLGRSRSRKRKSFALPSTMSSSRQQSPAGSMGPPMSPIRTGRSRNPSDGTESMQSPVMSPTLPASEFSSPRLVGQYQPHQLQHRRQSSAFSEMSRIPLSPRLNSITAPQPRPMPVSIKDFEIIKPISKGAFGSVYLSKKKSTGDYYAIKVLKKADMVAKNQVSNVKAERAIMMWQGESDFVAKLYWTFASKDYLYLVMEYLNGGDCASLIKVLGGLPEDWAKKYIAEVVLGIEHLHSRGIVHRDLKPDNLLIDQKGHLKLTDFGLSRMGLIGRQKRLQNTKSNEAGLDLLRQGPFPRAMSLASSRSTSFDFQGSQSAGHTPHLTPAFTTDIGQPSYFSLSRDTSATREGPSKTSGRSDSGESDTLSMMFHRFSLADELPTVGYGRGRSPIEEEAYSEEGEFPEPYAIQHTASQSSQEKSITPPQPPSMLPPPMALFNPEDSTRRFVGTPDYLAPETVKGHGQDERSDWWSLGCILFEFLYGYPPFHAESPDEVFENILARKIDWSVEEESHVSEEAKDLINRLLCTDPNERLGANDKFASGGEQIRKHSWFADVNWETLKEDKASFVPACDDPESTEYFDARGATLQGIVDEFADQASPTAVTPAAEYPERPHDALSRVRSQVNASSLKRGLIPLHIPSHVRENRTRRLSEPVATDDFGSFSFKNLPILERANKDVIQKLRAEAMQAQSRSSQAFASPSMNCPSPSLEGSPIFPAPLKRALSANRGHHRSASPSMLTQSNPSPNRTSQPSSPLLVSFSAGYHHERRKTSSGSASLSHQSSNALQPGSFFDVPKVANSFRTTPTASSPIKLMKTSSAPPDRALVSHLGAVSGTSPRARSHTVGSSASQVSSEGSGTLKDLIPHHHHKRRSQALDLSPSSSDNEDPRQRALLRVQRRRQSARKLSAITLGEGPVFRPLDVLICEDHPVSKLVTEKLLEKLRCRTISVQSGPEAMRYAMSEVKFDIILMEFKLPRINGADVARMIRETKNANSHTPIIAVTGYLKDLQAPHHFDALIEKPPTTSKLIEVMSKLCQWRAPPPGWIPAPPTVIQPSNSRRESIRLDDSPTSTSSGFAAMPASSYRGSSREDSISSSGLGDTDKRGDDVPVIISRQAMDDWREMTFGGLGITEEEMPEPFSETLIHHPPRLRSERSAPAALDNRAPPNKGFADRARAKGKQGEYNRRTSAESGDDEDEELGHTQVRARSPRARELGRAKRASKLGTEMMRTNSSGSVVSDTVDDMSVIDALQTSQPPVIAEDKVAEEMESLASVLSPPEIFPRVAAGAVKNFQVDVGMMFNAEASATPRKPPRANELDRGNDPDETPRPLSSLSHEAIVEDSPIAKAT